MDRIISEDEWVALFNKLGCPTAYLSDNPPKGCGQQYFIHEGDRIYWRKNG